MSSLIGIHSLSKAFGSQVLFENISMTFCQGDRIVLLGPNGAGKSTLLKIIADLEQPDGGYVSKRQGLRIGYASQLPEFSADPLEHLLVKEVPLRDEIENLTKARTLLSKAQFSDFAQMADSLSGGWKKRFDIIRCLMHDPDFLLLDEPTNHLDLEGILWLEQFLKKEKISYLIVSHDRYFLENTAEKVIELNRCYPQGYFVSQGNMTSFHTHKKAFLEAQKQEEKGLASIVRNEVDWMKRSPKARTTKSRSRLQKANELIEDLSEIRNRNKTVKVNLDFSASDRETRKLLVAKNLAKSIGEQPLFKGIDITLSPGTRLGIVGKNGTGKTTLLKILSGQLPQDMGTIKYADDLHLVYFDQHREQIPPHLTLKQALAPVNDRVNYRGQWIHVNGWAKKFLFSPDRLELPIGYLSGGERARILIAKLMLQPADILFLDEPTNDLDIPTLEVIEESLNEFPGALVLITHDRYLMDKVCTNILGLGEENEQQLFADYAQWEGHLKQKTSKKIVVEESQAPPSLLNKKTKKRSYLEQKEWEKMEETILVQELVVKDLQDHLNQPAMHTDAQKSLECYRQLADAQKKLEQLFDRWEYLTNL